MAEILKDRVRYHVVDRNESPESEHAEAAEELMDLVRAWLRTARTAVRHVTRVS